MRNNNPMRKSFVKNNIHLVQFDALIKLTTEMSKYLYPFIREILLSREDHREDPEIWNNFKNRYTDLISERFNTNSMKVQKLLDSNHNEEMFLRNLLILGLCTSNNGYEKLRNILFDF